MHDIVHEAPYEAEKLQVPSLLVACLRTMQLGQNMPGPLFTMMLSLGAGAFLHQISEHSMIDTQPVAAWQIDGTGA
jgi:hypothetical protein